MDYSAPSPPLPFSLTSPHPPLVFGDWCIAFGSAQDARDLLNHSLNGALFLENVPFLVNLYVCGGDAVSTLAPYFFRKREEKAVLARSMQAVCL